MLNSLAMKDRIKKGKAREEIILLYLNKYTEGVWTPSTEGQDMFDKIDAWWLLNGTTRSVQIKTRDDRADLGLELIRKYVGHEDFVQRYNNGTLTYGRDYKKQVDIYISGTHKQLHIICASFVKIICDEMLELLAKKKDFDKTLFTNIKNGTELRVVRDIGSGYTEGEFKLICYIQPAYLKEINAARSYKIGN